MEQGYGERGIPDRFHSVRMHTISEGPLYKVPYESTLHSFAYTWKQFCSVLFGKVKR